MEICPPPPQIFSQYCCFLWQCLSHCLCFLFLFTPLCGRVSIIWCVCPLLSVGSTCLLFSLSFCPPLPLFVSLIVCTEFSCPMLFLPHALLLKVSAFCVLCLLYVYNFLLLVCLCLLICNQKPVKCVVFTFGFPLVQGLAYISGLSPLQLQMILCWRKTWLL